MPLSVSRSKPLPLRFFCQGADMPIALTPRSCLRAFLIWGLLAFFTLGSAINLVTPDSIAADYARWGYPAWFPRVTGLLEAMAAMLLARQATRRRGAALAGLVMVGALATLLLNGDYGHATAPLIVLMALGLCLHLDEKWREARWEGKVF